MNGELYELNENCASRSHNLLNSPLNNNNVKRKT